MATEPLIDVRNLSLRFRTDEGLVTAVDDVSFSIAPGKVLGLVGESGSGKSVTAKALMHLNARNARYDDASRITLNLDASPIDVLSLKRPRDLKVVRGGAVSMIFQEPMASFAPAISIGRQMIEQLQIHTSLSKMAARDLSIEMLARVGIADAHKRVDQYAFELSGGMRQRAMIAMALSTRPRLLIADEPTTALDVTIQAQVLELMRDLVAEFGMAILFITHDLGVVAQTADEVAVMYLGRIVESGPVANVLHHPEHPYTQGLLHALPRLDAMDEPLTPVPGDIPSPLERPPGCVFHTRCAHVIEGRCDREVPLQQPLEPGHAAACHLLDNRDSSLPVTAPVAAPVSQPATIEAQPAPTQAQPGVSTPDADAKPLVDVANLSVHFGAGKGLLSHGGLVRAVDDVSLQIARGEFFGLVGESGSGKTTLGRALLRAAPITDGAVSFDDGEQQLDIHTLSGKALKGYRRYAQLIFQDPYAALSPRMTVRDIIAEPLEVMKLTRSREETDQRVREIATKCRLNLEHLRRFPHAFSGGQRQRISIARALVCRPRFLVADESVAALDVSIQADILNLLKALQAELGLTFLFISHDLSVIAHTCDKVAVMYLGTLVETAPTHELFANPLHPYTRALLTAIPSLDPDDRHKVQKLEGEIPSPTNPPSGCRFHTRCPSVTDICRREAPTVEVASPGHTVVCHRWREL